VQGEIDDPTEGDPVVAGEMGLLQYAVEMGDRPGE
jgi:hypothetical protein